MSWAVAATSALKQMKLWIYENTDIMGKVSVIYDSEIGKELLFL
jgi:hypothetical protein